MILTTETILLYLVALSLTVATLWPFSYATQTVKEGDPQWLLLVVVIPFVMLIYFGVAFIISDTIGDIGAAPPDNKLSSLESLVVAVSYVGLSGWLWLRWRNPTAPSTKVLGPVIIGTVVILIIADVIWAAQHNHIF